MQDGVKRILQMVASDDVWQKVNRTGRQNKEKFPDELLTTICSEFIVYRERKRARDLHRKRLRERDRKRVRERETEEREVYEFVNVKTFPFLEVCHTLSLIHI